MFKRYSKMKILKIFNKGKILLVTHSTFPQFVTTTERVCLHSFKGKTTPKSSGATDGLGSVFTTVEEKNNYLLASSGWNNLASSAHRNIM